MIVIQDSSQGSGPTFWSLSLRISLSALRAAEWSWWHGDTFSPSPSHLDALPLNRKLIYFNLENIQLNLEVQWTISSCFLLFTYVPCPWLHPTHDCQVNLPKSTARMVLCHSPWPVMLNLLKCTYAPVKENWLEFHTLAVKAFVSQAAALFWFLRFFSMLLLAPKRLRHHSTEVPHIL